jgi:hypothetical protein
MNDIKVTKSFTAGFYYATGYVQDVLSQYSVVAERGRWKITRVFGNGPHFYVAYGTKRQAIEAIRTA